MKWSSASKASIPKPLTKILNRSLMQQAIGLALVVLQAALMGLLSRTVQFPVLVVLLAAFGALTRWRIPLSREQAFLLSSAAAFYFLLQHRFFPHDFPTGTEFIRTHVAFIIAQFLMLIQAAHFIVRGKDDPLSPVLPALGAVALICIADIQITSEQRTMTLLFAVTYPMLWALYLWACRNPMPVPPPDDEARQARRMQAQRRRRLTAGFVLAAIATTAWFSSLGLYEFEKKLEGWLVQMMAGSSSTSQVGFSRSSKLGSVARKKSQTEEQIALSVYSQRFPGYFRGAVFSHYEASEWNSPLASRGLQITKTEIPPPGLRPLQEAENLYAHPAMAENPAGDWRYWECWLAEDQDSAAFTPLGTTHLITAANQVGIWPFGVFLLYDNEASSPYTVCVPENSQAGWERSPADEKFLQIPEQYREELTELARPIFANAHTPQEKLHAVERHFQDNYRYHLGIEIPYGEDPLLYFLREKPAAHCEYFASAAALLLRAAGVPTRYVTGLVVAEWNPSGEYWVARNRDAHAWVEAYVEPQGWGTVEATPAEGVPSTDPHSPRFAWWEALRNDWFRLRAFLSQGRWSRARSVLGSSWLGVFLGTFFLAFAGYVALRIPWPRGLFAKPKPPNLEPGLMELQKLLTRMDRQLGSHGLKRGSGETLHQFAQRIRNWDQWRVPRPRAGSSSTQEEPAQHAEQTAQWYHAYADCRYQGQWDEQTLKDLRSRFPSG